MTTHVISRDQVGAVIDNITKHPTFIFSVVCERRTDLELRYPPLDRFTNGPLAYIGDASRLDDRERVRFCDCGGNELQHATPWHTPDWWVELTATSRKCKRCGAKREKIVLEDAGTARRMIVKGKNNDKETKHWKSKGGTLSFDPAAKGLKLVAGMYQDRACNHGTGKREGRHGQWRSWAFICLRSVSIIKWMGQVFIVV